MMSSTICGSETLRLNFLAFRAAFHARWASSKTMACSVERFRAFVFVTHELVHVLDQGPDLPSRGNPGPSIPNTVVAYQRFTNDLDERTVATEEDGVALLIFAQSRIMDHVQPRQSLSGTWGRR